MILFNRSIRGSLERLFCNLYYGNILSDMPKVTETDCLIFDLEAQDFQ